jgi:hypothetical protein
MLNIINADFFRVRKGKAIYATLLGILGIILFTAILLKLISSEDILNQAASSNSGILTIEGNMDGIENSTELLSELVPENGSAFAFSMYGDVGNIITIFILVFIITIFGTDYSAGAYKNSLSYHSNRCKIYLSKLLLSSGLAIGLLFALGLMSLIVGGIFFGFHGYAIANLLPAVTAIALMIPMMLTFISIGYCIIAFTKKVSATIATYIVGILACSTLLQIARMVFPTKVWLSRLDLMSSMGQMTKYQALSAVEILTPIGLAVAIIILTTSIGMYKYQKTDFDFN